MTEPHLDKNLVDQIVSGSVTAWHEFVERYGNLIHAVVRRHVFDDEDVHDVFVDVLDRLYNGGFESYEGRAALSTWLALVVRGHSMDFLRRKLGRRRIPQSVEELGEPEITIFRVYHMDGMSLDGLRHRLREDGHDLPLERILEALETIESGLERWMLRRLAYELDRTQTGLPGRLQEFGDLARVEHEEASFDTSPEQAMVRAEERVEMEEIKKLMEKLPDQEREVLRLRFDDNLTAKQIAHELDLDGQRRVYSIADRAVQRLRRWWSDHAASETEK